jgi:hypothetical protein
MLPADDSAVRTSRPLAVGIIAGGCILSLSGCSTVISNPALPRLRVLELAATASERAPYTAGYRDGEIYSVVYSQAPPKGQVVQTNPHGGMLIVTTGSSGSTQCLKLQGAASRCIPLPASGSALLDFHSPASSLGFLRTIAGDVSSGQSVAMSTSRIGGLPAYCFTGEAVGPPASTIVCFTAGGILAYFSGTSGHGGDRLVTYKGASSL